MSDRHRQNLNKNLKSGKTRIPFIVEDLFGKTTPNKIMANLAESWLDRQRQAAAMTQLADMRRMEKDVLHAQYAHHLGRRHSYVSDVLTEYPTIAPKLDMQALDYDIATGKPVLNTEYFKKAKEYETNRQKHKERQDLENEIRGLHIRFPQLKRLHQEISSKIEAAQNILRS